MVFQNQPPPTAQEGRLASYGPTSWMQQQPTNPPAYYPIQIQPAGWSNAMPMGQMHSVQMPGLGASMEPGLMSSTKHASEDRGPNADASSWDEAVSDSERTHKQVHKSKREYKCPICDHVSSCSSNLNRHKRIHSGDKPCVFLRLLFFEYSRRCCSVFTDLHSFGERYTCSHCGCAFANSSNRKKHEKKCAIWQTEEGSSSSNRRRRRRVSESESLLEQSALSEPRRRSTRRMTSSSTPPTTMPASPKLEETAHIESHVDQISHSKVQDLTDANSIGESVFYGPKPSTTCRTVGTQTLSKIES